MTVFIVGGAGFIGRRLIPKLVDAGERVVCM
ncbi:MAG: nucleoside-diphosphate-sugar epimerase, partial [Gammaproteobacteria bacterium]